MTRKIIVVFFCCLLSGVSGYFMTKVVEGQAPSLDGPFTIRMIDTDTPPEGINVPPTSWTYLWARNDKKEVVSIKTIDSGVVNITVVTPASITSMIPGTGMKSTVYGSKAYNNNPLIKIVPFGSKCSPAGPNAPKTSRYLGEGSHLGYPVFKYESESENIITESWYAPALNCFPVYRKTSRPANDDSGCSTTERKVVEVIFGPPDPALFLVPADLKEVRPSEMTDYYRMMKGFASSKSGGANRSDELYDKYRTKKN